MGAKDRRAYQKEGTAILRASQKVCGTSGYAEEDVVSAIEDLVGQCELIIEDYQECQDNLADQPGLLANWEESNYDLWMEWESIKDDLNAYVCDEDMTAEECFDEVVEIWERGEV